MKYYHGTHESHAEQIDAEGFRGSELSTMTDGFTTQATGGVVFVADNAEHASDYGDVVYEIELLNGDATEFAIDANGRKEYYITIQQMNDEGIWNRK